MSIINDAIKRARKEFEVENKSAATSPVKIEPSPILKPDASPGASEVKWTAIVVISLVVIASLFGSLLLYRSMTDIKADTSLSSAPDKVLTPQPFIPKRALSVREPGSPIILNGIVHGPTDKWAIINDRIAREDDSILGGTLTLIEENFVEILLGDGEKLVLELR